MNWRRLAFVVCVGVLGMGRRAAGSGAIEWVRGVYRGRLPRARTIVAQGPDREKVARELEARIASMRGLVAAPGDGSVASFCVRVLDMRAAQDYRDVKSDRGRCARFIAGDRIGRMPLGAVTRADVREWLGRVATSPAKRGGKPLSRSAVANVLSLLRTCFAHAADAGHVDRSPVDGVRVPRSLGARGAHEDTWTVLSDEEIERMFWLAPTNDDREAFAFAVFTGLRQGEQWFLERSDLEVEASIPHIIVRRGSKGKSPKNGKVRRVPLFGLAESVAKMRLVTCSGNLVFGTGDGAARVRGAAGGPRAWKAWLRRAGITRRVRWHDLRHTCASALVNGRWGERVWTLAEVSKMLGHSSIAVTQRYAHAGDDPLFRAAEQMVFASPRATRESHEEGNAVSRRGRDSNPRMTVLQTVDAGFYLPVSGDERGGAVAVDARPNGSTAHPAEVISLAGAVAPSLSSLGTWLAWRATWGRK